MKIKLFSNNLLIARVPTEQVGSIFMPPSMMDEHNNGLTKMYKLLAKGPGRMTRKGALIPFEAQPGDNLVITLAGHGPQEVSKDRFIVQNPEQIVLAVVPEQTPPATALESD